MREIERLNREEEDRKRRVAREDKETRIRKERRRIEAELKAEASKQDDIKQGRSRKRPGVLKERQEKQLNKLQVREEGIREAAKKYKVSSAKPVSAQRDVLLLREQAKEFSKRVNNPVQPNSRVIRRKIPKLNK